MLPQANGVAVSLANGRVYQLRASAPAPNAAAREQATSYRIAEEGVHVIDHSGLWAIATTARPNGSEDTQSAADELHLLAMNEPSAAPRALPVPGSLAARPRAFADGLVAPLRIGQVLLLDPTDGTSLAAPFQPPIDPARLPEWTAPATVSPGESFAIADRHGTVYLVGVERDPPRLVTLHRSNQLQSSIVGQLCVTPSTVVATTADRQLVALELPDLAKASARDLSEELVWGPFAAADVVLFATADDRLHRVSNDGSAIAETSISARPVGRPLPLAESTISVALGDGTLLGLNQGTRSVSAIGDAGQPLALGPVPWGGRLYAATPDGVLVSVPATAPERVASAAVSN
jgi:hypothetical protein